jgi:hypothetical protein
MFSLLLPATHIDCSTRAEVAKICKDLPRGKKGIWRRASSENHAILLYARALENNEVMVLE